LFFDEVFQLLGQRQKGVIARSILFRPGGLLARELARHAVVLKVNDWVFCHGGLLPHHGKYFVAFFLFLLFNLRWIFTRAISTIYNSTFFEFVLP